MSARSKPTLSRPSHRAARDPGAQGSESDPSPPTTLTVVGGGRIRVALDASIDVRISTIAAAQRGRAARRQLLACAVSPEAIKRRARAGRLERVHAGVYGLPGTAELPLAAETAALLACGMNAMLSHHSAATLWQLRPGAARPVHVTLPRDRDHDRGYPAPAEVVVHRSLTLSAADIARCEGLPLTSPARTLLDVASTLPDRDIELLLDEALFVRRIVTRAQLRELLARAGHHPGRARLARVLSGHAHSTKTDSPPEERMLALIRAAALPEPRLRFHILDYRLDFFWPELRLALEVDAYGTHGSRARFESDRRRDARLLTEKGISTLRVTDAMIDGRPFEAIALVARAIGRCEVAQRAP